MISSFLFMPTPTQIEIARQAEYIWRLRGCPIGLDSEIWNEAERQLRQGLSSPGGDQSPGSFTERAKEETAAESVVEYQISPAGSEEESIRAAMQKPAAPSPKSNLQQAGKSSR